MLSVGSVTTATSMPGPNLLPLRHQQPALSFSPAVDTFSSSRPASQVSPDSQLTFGAGANSAKALAEAFLPILNDVGHGLTEALSNLRNLIPAGLVASGVVTSRVMSKSPGPNPFTLANA